MGRDGGEERIGALDGLRALAITLVFLRHFVVGGDANRGIRSVFFKVADAGWMGVDLFFVLSGFLITGILLRSVDAPHRFRNFYVRRALRIFPLYYVALFIVFVVVPLFECQWLPFRQQLPYWLYVANFRTNDAASACIQVGHFWSLAIEEQYYALWPAVVLLTSQRTARRACAFLLLLGLIDRACLVASNADWRAYYWTMARMDGLASGSYLALAWVTPRLRERVIRLSIPAALVSGSVIAGLVWRGRLDMTFDRNPTIGSVVGRMTIPLLLAVFFSALVVLGVKGGRLTKVLDTSLSRSIARYSYGLYVWHLIVFNAVFSRVGAFGIWQRAAIATIVTAAAAITSFHLLEAPMLSFKRFFPQPGIRS